jgi:hypothetical protein
VQDLPADENKIIDDGFSRDVLPETKHPAILAAMHPFKWLSRKYMTFQGIRSIKKEAYLNKAASNG